MSDNMIILFSHLPMYFYTVASRLNINSLTVAGAAPALLLLNNAPASHLTLLKNCGREPVTTGIM